MYAHFVVKPHFEPRDLLDRVACCSVLIIVMDNEDPKAFAHAISASLESSQRPVRKKKIPLKLIDSSYALSDVFSDEQLTSKHTYFSCNA